MKHLKTFENFVNEDITNEIWGQEFFTGHQKGGKEVAKKKILDRIDEYIDEISSHPQNNNPWGYSNIDKLKSDLLKAAEENNWKGHLEDRQSQKDGLWYVVYVPGTSGVQNMASGMAAGTGMKKMSSY